MRIAERLAWLMLAAAITGSILLVPPIVGFGDNGDFSKITARFDMASPPEDEARYITRSWVFDERNRWTSEYFPSGLLLVAPPIEFVRRVLGYPAFDLRIVGVVHATVFLSAWWLLLPLAGRPLADARGSVSHLNRDREGAEFAVRFALLALTLLVFCDVMYVSYYNSFYMDTAALLFLLLSAVLFVRAVLRPGRTAALAFALGCVLLVSSKAQHALLAPPVAALLAWQGEKPWPGGGRAFRVLAALAVLAAAVFQFRTSPPGYARPALFSSIFHGILPKSPDVSGDLRRLGLDDSFRKYVGIHAYMPGSPLDDPAFQQEFDRRTSHGKLALLYLARPTRAFGRIVDGLDHAGLQRVFELGNFTRDSGEPARGNSHRFSLWSDLKRGVFGLHAFRYAAWWLALAGGLCWVLRRNTELLAGALTLAAMSAIALLLASLADSLEKCRHLFLFNALLDVMLVSLVAAVAARFTSPARHRSGHSATGS